MAEKNHVQVMIAGKMMTLVGTDSPEYMKKVAEYIEEKNKEIRSGKNGKRMNVAMTSILTSINVADDFFKETEKNKALEERIAELETKLAESEKEVKISREEIEQLNRDIYILKDDMNMIAEKKAYGEDQIDEYYVSLDSGKNTTLKNNDKQ